MKKKQNIQKENYVCKRLGKEIQYKDNLSFRVSIVIEQNKQLKIKKNNIY